MENLVNKILKNENITYKKIINFVIGLNIFQPISTIYQNNYHKWDLKLI